MVGVGGQGGREQVSRGGGCQAALESDTKRKLNSNLCGNEIYYTNYLIPLVKNILCGELHCQKGFNSILLRNREARGRAGGHDRPLHYEATGVPRSQETTPPLDPIVGSCLGPCGDPGGGAPSYERGTPVLLQGGRMRSMLRESIIMLVDFCVRQNQVPRAF